MHNQTKVRFFSRAEVTDIASDLDIQKAGVRAPSSDYSMGGSLAHDISRYSVDVMDHGSSTVVDENLRSREGVEGDNIENTKWKALTRAGTWSRKRIMQACILVVAVVGTVVGMQRIVTRVNTDKSNVHRVQLQSSDMLQVTSRASAPYRRPQLFHVGGENAVWMAPSKSDFFTSWAAGISFREGDVLHVVGATRGTYLYEVPETSYNACTTTGYVTWWYLNYQGKELFLQLTEIKKYNFVQGDDPVPCINGLKFAATVNPMDIPAAPPRPNVNVTARKPRVFEVGGDKATWTVPNATSFYENWAKNISFVVGDVLSFTLADTSFEVTEVPYSSYEQCTTTGYTWYSSSSKTYQLTAAGIKYFVASTPAYCVQGLRFTANVYSTGGTSVPGSSPTSGDSPYSTSSSPSKFGSASSLKNFIAYIVGGVIALAILVCCCAAYIGNNSKPPQSPELPVVRTEPAHVPIRGAIKVEIFEGIRIREVSQG